MELVKTAIEWTKAEIFSASFFILFGLLFMAASAGFWQLGKTDLAKAFLVPTLVAGILLLVIGIGLRVSNQARVNSFAADHDRNPAAFVETEIARADKTIGEYQTMAFKVFPTIIALAALLLVFLAQPLWRAISITTIAMLVVVVVFIDSTALARMEAYKKQLNAYTTRH